MEKFFKKTKPPECKNNTITIEFKSRVDFECALLAWDRVNGNHNDSFILVVGQGDCDWNEHRLPYIINSFTYDERKLEAVLDGHVADFKAVMRSYELFFSTNPDAHHAFDSRFSIGDHVHLTPHPAMSTASSVRKRIASDAVPIVTNSFPTQATGLAPRRRGLAADFINNVTKPIMAKLNDTFLVLDETLYDSSTGVEVGTHCNGCGVFAEFDVDYHIAERFNAKETFKGVLKHPSHIFEYIHKIENLTSGSVKIYPRGNITFQLSLSLNVTKTNEDASASLWHKESPEIPLVPDCIEGVLCITPVLTFRLDIGISNISKSAALEANVKAAIDKSAYVRFDFDLSHTGIIEPNAKGWTPHVVDEPELMLDARNFGGDLTMALNTSLVLKAELGRKSFQMRSVASTCNLSIAALAIDTGLKFVVPQVIHHLTTYKGKWKAYIGNATSKLS